MFMPLRFAKFRVDAEARDTLHLPRCMGSCLRGSTFGLGKYRTVSCSCEEMDVREALSGRD